MKKNLYYCIMIIANIVLAVIFYRNINITILSFVPIFLIALIVFQVKYFKNEKVENDFRTTYGSNLTEDEETSMFEYISKALIAIIPWMIPFVIFFSSLIKALSIFVYVFGFISGALMYRLRNRDKVLSRIKFEEKEREEQEKKEQLGKWK